MFTTQRLKKLLAKHGEIVVTVEEYPEPIDLHKYDTTIHDGEVRKSLSDGGTIFAVGRVTGVTWHKESTTDLGL